MGGYIPLRVWWYEWGGIVVIVRGECGVVRMSVGGRDGTNRAVW